MFSIGGSSPCLSELMAISTLAAPASVAVITAGPP
jgi:hypothetical protein